MVNLIANSNFRTDFSRIMWDVMNDVGNMKMQIYLACLNRLARTVQLSVPILFVFPFVFNSLWGWGCCGSVVEHNPLT